MYSESVTSPANAKFKLLLSLREKSRERKEKGLFVVEGRREIEHCIEGGYTVDTLFVCDEILGGDLPENWDSLPSDLRVIHIPKAMYAKASCREGTEGVIAEVRTAERNLFGLNLPENPLVVVLEGVEKPGNIGAVLRSADAAGVDAVLICDPLTDLYNPNLIRASLGAVFTLQIAAVSSEEAINWLKDNGIKIFTAQLQDSLPYYDTPMTGGTALVMGTESTGLTSAWREAADGHIRIPMMGRLDSLNVSVSAAILMFEALRQRIAVSEK